MTDSLMVHGMWVGRGEFMRSMEAAGNTLDAADICWANIAAYHPGAVDVRKAKRTEGVIRAHAVRTSQRELMQARQLAVYQTAVDELLSLVPARAGSIEVARLNEVAFEVARRSDSLIPGAGCVVMIREETDPDSSAKYRLETTFSGVSEIDGEALGNAAIDLHEYLASIVDPQEYQAIRLIVRALDGRADGSE